MNKTIKKNEIKNEFQRIFNNYWIIKLYSSVLNFLKLKKYA